MKISYFDLDKQIVIVSSDKIYLKCNFWDSFIDSSIEITNLFAYGVKEIEYSYYNNYSAEEVNGLYKICACVFDKNLRIVKLDDVFIELDEPFPGDIAVEDFVIFTAIRIDI